MSNASATRRNLFITTGTSLATKANCWRVDACRQAWSNAGTRTRHVSDVMRSHWSAIESATGVEEKVATVAGLFDPDCWSLDRAHFPGLDLGAELEILKRYHALATLRADDRVVLIHDTGNESHARVLRAILSGPAMKDAIDLEFSAVVLARLEHARGNPVPGGLAAAIDELGIRLEELRRAARRNIYLIGPGNTALIGSMVLFAQYASEGSWVEMFCAEEGLTDLVPLPIHPGDTFGDIARRRAL